jgi:hypothetical protein
MSHSAGNRPAVSKRGSHHGGANKGIVKMAMLFAGLVILVFALPPFFNFPWVDFWLLPLAGVYLFLLFILPRLWLFVLPLVTVGMDITPWTGRFVYNELDLVFLVTLASGLLYGRYRFRVFAPNPGMIVMLSYLVVIALAYNGWTNFLLPPQAAFENPYYSTEYAYKVLKGLLWGVSLVPMWGYLLAVDKQRAVNALVMGMSLAAVLLAMIVLWERGTLHVLLGGAAWYHVVSSLLDLTSSYRVTAVFSDMHTGGEVIDGVVLMLLPACLYAAAYGQANWMRLLGATGFMALAYVTLVGFTRATYVAFVVALAIYCAITLWSRRKSGLPYPVSIPWLSASLCSALVAAVLAYRYAGSYGLASFGVLLMLAYIANQVALQGVVRHGISLVALVLIALAINAHWSSRWVEPSLLASLILALVLVACYVLALGLFRESKQASAINRLFLLGGTMVLPITLAVALGGYQINERMTRVGADLGSRENHWGNVIASSQGGLWSILIGNGVGSYPGRYIRTHPQKVEEVGSFSIVPEQRRNVLLLGGGRDLAIGQRVAIAPYTNYSINVSIRAKKSGSLLLSLCERNLIYATTFEAHSGCAEGTVKFEATDGVFEQQTVEISSDKIGSRRALGRWPTVLLLHYDQVGAVVEIDSITFSADGFNILRNGSFKEGLDYWFQYDDFSHLPWHVKNLMLQVWFETGWLGLGLLLALLGLLIRTNFERHSRDSLLPVYSTAVFSLCILGLFGSPLDSARVSWMFYFFLVAPLSSLRVRRRGR